jgi:hypothetical protein
MINQQEQKLIAKFVNKAKQDRYLTFLSKEKTRHKFTEELYHFRDFNWNLFREIPGSESEWETVAAEVKKKKISTCYVISVDLEYDGKFVSVDEAIEDVIGTEGTILVFGGADVIYYEGEAPSRRYISI